MLRTVQATRYVTPLREGGSLPAIIEADDDGLYVLKFRGAGQGPKALISELIGGEVARLVGLPTPELVFVVLDPIIGRSEPDYEIRQLITNSEGLNLALDYLPGSVTFDARRRDAREPLEAAGILWLDAYLTNPDRTARNTNMLLWHDKLWLIDHAASLYFHHNWSDHRRSATAAYARPAEHVFSPFKEHLAVADERLRPFLTNTALTNVANLIPDAWLEPTQLFDSRDALRQGYVEFLQTRRDRMDQIIGSIQEA